MSNCNKKKNSKIAAIKIKIKKIARLSQENLDRETELTFYVQSNIPLD